MILVVFPLSYPAFPIIYRGERGRELVVRGGGEGVGGGGGGRRGIGCRGGSESVGGWVDMRAAKCGGVGGMYQ